MRTRSNEQIQNTFQTRKQMRSFRRREQTFKQLLNNENSAQVTPGNGVINLSWVQFSRLTMDANTVVLFAVLLSQAMVTTDKSCQRFFVYNPLLMPYTGLETSSLTKHECFKTCARTTQCAAIRWESGGIYNLCTLFLWNETDVFFTLNASAVTGKFWIKRSSGNFSKYVREINTQSQDLHGNSGSFTPDQQPEEHTTATEVGAESTGHTTEVEAKFTAYTTEVGATFTNEPWPEEVTATIKVVCPATFTEFASGCFGLITDTLSWDEARQDCEANYGPGGRLAELDTEQVCSFKVVVLVFFSTEENQRLLEQ